MKKIKIVWICHLSNSKVRANLTFDRFTPLALIKRVLRKSDQVDFAVWNTNAIKEFEKFEDVELHIIAPYMGISGLQEFEINGVNYHFFETENDNIISLIKSRCLKVQQTSFRKNSYIINYLIKQISPDLIHMIGAENPYYSESANELPSDIPLIVTLQTLMNDPEFKQNYPISDKEYNYRSSVEASVIRRANYIGTKVEHFRKCIREIIAPDANFLDISLAVGEDIKLENFKKYYDFVYFAADISKAADWAIEAYAIAKQINRDITLHIVGGCTEAYKNRLEARLKELNINDGVDFTGRLATHDDVISEIRKARFALLPLKVDLITGTIRESMANGIPVITTVTPLTPELNSTRESVLLSEKGDFNTMAANMIRLLKDPDYAEMLRMNAASTLNERYSNLAIISEWYRGYYDIINQNGR